MSRKLGKLQDRALLAAANNEQKKVAIAKELMSRKCAFVEAVLNQALRSTNTELGKEAKKYAVQTVMEELPISIVANSSIDERMKVATVGHMLREILTPLEERASKENKTLFYEVSAKRAALADDAITAELLKPNPALDIGNEDNVAVATALVEEAVKKSPEVKPIEEKLVADSGEQADAIAAGSFSEVEQMAEDTIKNNYEASKIALAMVRKQAEESGVNVSAVEEEAEKAEPVEDEGIVPADADEAAAAAELSSLLDPENGIAEPNVAQGAVTPKKDATSKPMADLMAKIAAAQSKLNS